MLTPPAFTYALDMLPGAPRQSVTGADRPACALVAAGAAYMRGVSPLMGAARKMTPEQIELLFDQSLSALGIPAERAELWARAINGQRTKAMPTPDAINGLTPSAYQIGAVYDLTCAGGVLNLGVGLGKTLTTAYAAKCYTQVAGNRRCWIVAPLVAHGAWKVYVPYLKTMYADVKILSVDSAHKFVGAAADGGLLIVDEAHYVGAMAARRTQAMHKIRLGFDVCLCLTGTLLHGGVEKALGVLDLAIPGAAGFSSKWKAGEYFNVLARKKIGQRTVTSLEKPTGPRKQAFLEYISRYTVALTKESPQVRAEVQIPGQDLHLIELGDAHGDLDSLIAQTAIAMLDETGEMPSAQAVMHAVMRQGVEAKIDWLLDQMDEPDQGVVVFANYHESLDKIQAALTDNAISFVRVDGSVTGIDREEAVRKFQAGEVQVFLGQMTAAGAAINLFRSHISVTFDWCQKGADYAQMLGRTCRRGQDLHCHHFDLVCNPLQIQCVERLRAAEDFHMDLSRFAQSVRGLTPEQPGKE